MLKIAAVSSDENVRLQLARAFDSAPSSWIVTLHHGLPAEADVVVCGPDRKFEGGVLFDPERPSQLVPDIAARVARAPGRGIFVVGAAGGCGASSVALHLAAAGGACVIEASGQDLRRRLTIPSAKSWAEVLVDEPLELSALPVAPGLRVLLSPRVVSDEDVSTVLERALPLFDHVLVDVEAERLDTVSRENAIGVLVMPPTRPAVERAREILDAHSLLRWAIVTNRTGPGGTLRGRALESVLERKIAVELPCSAALRDAEDEGRLLTSPLSPWLWQIKRLWRALATA